MQGRKPTAAIFKIVTGNPGRHPINVEEFQPAVEIPPMPSHLKKSREATHEWKRITAELARYGLISAVDRAALVFYCVNWARHCEAEDYIAKAEAAGGSGLFIKTPNGYPVQSPWLAVSNKSMELCRTFLAEFGMSPAARTKVVPSTQLPLPGMEPPPKGGFDAL